MKSIIVLVTVIFSTIAFAQKDTLNILFLGNSYTYYNNLPNMVETLVEETGIEVNVSSNTPGGYTLKGHTTNATSIQKIKEGIWDFVILQEQSQLPSFPLGQVQTETFPYAQTLDTLITKHNPCAETIFYNTWGRKNGDAGNCSFWPPVCTYQGMDSMLALRYKYMADTNKAVVSPVGPVWRNIRGNYPIIELYTSDESHPSLKGSYAAALSFFSVITRKDPSLTNNDFGIPTMDVINMKMAAKQVAFGELKKWNVGEYDSKAFFTADSVSAFDFDFINKSDWSNEYLWDFGDGNNSKDKNPNHVYADTGIYKVTLVSSSCGNHADTFSIEINIKNKSTVGVETWKNHIRISPNPAKNYLFINGVTDGVVELRNLSGKLVLTKPFSPALSISGIEQGVYFLSIKTEMGNFQKKVLIID